MSEVETLREEVLRLKRLRHRDALTIATVEGDSAAAEAAIRLAVNDALERAALLVASEAREYNLVIGEGPDSLDSKIRALKEPTP